jgi:gamma-glutamyltranspeptidase/glutathione hydrolase
MPRFSSALLFLLLAASADAASPPPVEAAHGMVVSSQHLASEIGAEILRQGGNAVDAAVAVGYAEAVTNPCCGNIGGGGFMVLHMADGRERFINFRETAPAAATATMYLDAAGNPVADASRFGFKAVAVPGTVMGLDRALTEFGSLSRERVMAPAIRLAREGFVLVRGDTDILDYGAEHFAKDPVVARIFLKPGGGRWQPGERLVQKDLAATLERVAQSGSDGFYKGWIAQSVARASASHGGILTEQDFAHYSVTEGPPLHCAYRGYEILTAMPPSAGGVTLCEILGILEGYDLKASGFHSAQSVHWIVEAMRHAYMDRNAYLGDPAFVSNPIDHLLSKDYLAAIRARIEPDRATPSSDVKPGSPPHEKEETTHYSVVDKAGNAVTVTYTINGGFGAVVIAPGTGFFLNDEMDDFAVKPGTANMFDLVQGQSDIIAPGKRPLSSMSPTIVLKDGKPVLVLGSPGGSRITTIVLEALINVVDYGLGPQEAVDLPRIHHQWLPDEIAVEPLALSPDTEKLLSQMGYTIKTQRPWGAAEMIEIAPSLKQGETAASAGIDTMLSGRLRPGMLYGANDDRRPAGSAAGY